MYWSIGERLPGVSSYLRGKREKESKEDGGASWCCVCGGGGVEEGGVGYNLFTYILGPIFTGRYDWNGNHYVQIVLKPHKYMV